MTYTSLFGDAHGFRKESKTLTQLRTISMLPLCLQIIKYALTVRNFSLTFPDMKKLNKCLKAMLLLILLMYPFTIPATSAKEKRHSILADLEVAYCR